MPRLFLTILEGDSPDKTHPVIATEDPEVIRTVARHLMMRLGLDDESHRPIERKLEELLRFPEGAQGEPS
ncbi:MAG: hypothetical protein IH937_11880 [Acidobacteria bacterium]|nr:hypothetical protein [Acidobacteriota bacterium]